MAALQLAFWILSFFSVAGLLGIVVYQLMCLSDLEFDYINPFDSSSSINKVVLPEFIIQGVLCALYLITGKWWMLLLNLPLAYYNLRLFMLNQHLVDVTEIFNRLSTEKKYRMIKLGFYIFLFFLVIYHLVVEAVAVILEHDSGRDLSA